MTAEGSIMIIILCLGMLKLFQDRKRFAGVLSLKSQFSLKQHGETILFFALSVIVGLLITNIIFGIILLNAILWALYHIWLKSLRYNMVAWLSLVIYWLYLYATYISFDKVPFTEIWYYSLFCWQVALLFILIYDTLGKLTILLPSLILWPISCAIAFMPFTFIAYKHSFGIPIQIGQLNAIYQTNATEVWEFVAMYLSPIWPVMLVLVIVGLFIAILFQAYSPRVRLNSSLYFYITAGLLLLVNLNVVRNLSILTMIVETSTVYAEEVSKFKKELDKRKVEDLKFSATKEKGKELYVIIIGESLNKNHMSLYGYHRNTSPRLQKLLHDSVITKYEEAYSTHTHTIPVLTNALTAAYYLGDRGYLSSPSILDVLEKADFNTYWLSNQIAYGGWDNPISVLSERADHKINFNSNLGEVVNTIVHDERLVVKLQEILARKITENTAIFIHLMGNHGNYENRYTPEFKKYTGVLDRKLFGSGKDKSIYVNAYDNSVLYNDNLVANIFTALQKAGGVSAGIYFSDHGEEVLSNKGHNSGNFTFSMIQIPLITWYSEAYKDKYRDKYNMAQEHTKHLFSTDFIFDLLIGMMGITTDQYRAEHDLHSDDYNLRIQECFTVDGTVPYGDRKNYYYHQRKNIEALDSLGLQARVYPHRVNSIGKLNQIFYNGCNSFEVDIMYRLTEEQSYFEVAHDDNAASGMKLEELLEYTKGWKLQTLWLDLKNLNENNIENIAKRLTELDQIFDIKKKAILESSTSSSSFADLANLGFHTSYYLPLDIVNLDQKDLSIRAARIATQIQEQQVSAVSFDVALYPFVKRYLEKLIQPNVVYHMWDLSLQLKDPEFRENLLSKNYFEDTRVKSILVGYKSEFEL